MFQSEVSISIQDRFDTRPSPPNILFLFRPTISDINRSVSHRTVSASQKMSEVSKCKIDTDCITTTKKNSKKIEISRMTEPPNMLESLPMIFRTSRDPQKFGNLHFPSVGGPIKNYGLNDEKS